MAEEAAARKEAADMLNALKDVKAEDYGKDAADALTAAREAAANPGSASMGELNDMLSRLKEASDAVKAEDDAVRAKIYELKKQLDALDESKYQNDAEALAAIKAAKDAVKNLTETTSKKDLNAICASLESMDSTIKAADKRIADAEEKQKKADQEAVAAAQKAAQDAAAAAQKAAQEQAAKEQAAKEQTAKAEFKLNVDNGKTVPLQVKKSSKKIVVKQIASFDKVKSVISSNEGTVKASLSGNAISIKAGKKPGKADVTVTTEYGASIKFAVKVQKKKVVTKKIVGVSKTLSLAAGQTVNLEAMTNPITSPDKVKYKSSAKKIAKVTGKGVLTAKKKGKATITIMAGKKKFVVKVTVN